MAKMTRSSAELSESNLASIFEERAEHLSRSDFATWTLLSRRERQTVKKLVGPGAKLLTGPRGSGKSTLLRAAYFESAESSDVLPVYVNYATSLALEPLFHRHANALQIFRQWLLAKIVVAAEVSFEEIDRRPPAELTELAVKAQSLIHDLGAGQDPSDHLPSFAPGTLLAQLERWASVASRRRVVLLLDDAAHAFSNHQQREFFEVFRELRSRRVSAKAAVYPGITSYSPYMHVGNEAELVEAWSQPSDDAYLKSMRELVSRRLPNEMLDLLEDRDEILDYLALASFGLPRGFLVMVSQVLSVDEETAARPPTRRDAEQAVAAHAQTVRDIFSALAVKMPRYKRFVETGQDLERAMSMALAQFNRNRPASSKAVMVGIAQPLEPELEKILGMLEYAGIVRKVDSVSRGEKGVFERYELHYALVTDANALSLGRSPSLAGIVGALTTRDAHAFARRNGTSLLGEDFALRCTLDLAPCQFCGTERISEDAQFCMKCGRSLSDASIYEELLKASIDALPLTVNKLAGLKEHTTIRTVSDILLDEESRQIRSVPYVGPVWAERIHRYAEEFVSV
jgi:ABC-type lipoprotein export system ATPase subunit